MINEEEVKKARKKVSDIENEIKNLEDEIRRIDSQRRQSQTNKHIGLMMMGNSTMRPLGTYKFISGSGEESRYTSKVSSLKAKLTNLKGDLSRAEKELRSAESRFAYESRPEAVLVVADDRIYIEGDDARRDIVKPLADRVVAYIQDYDSYAESPEVADYLKLKQELDKSVAESNLPEASRENLSEIKSAQIRTSFDFEYMVIDGKILVDRDFASSEITRYEREIDGYNTGIANIEAKKEEFRPSFLGRVFKSVGKKQKVKNDFHLDENIKELTTYRGHRELGLSNFQEYKDKYIIPAGDAIEILRKISNLASQNKNVGRFIKEGETARKHIDEKTVISALKNNPQDIVLSEIKGYLDSRGLKLTKETIFEAICQSDAYRWLAEQVCATGFKPKEQAEQTGTQPGEE